MNLVHITKSILIVSIVAGILNLSRFVMTGFESYLWLNWNLFLSLVPIAFAYLATRASSKITAFAMLILWLLFLPNAPYLITDFIHLAHTGPRSFLWYDGLMVFTYSLVGVAAWIVSVRTLVRHFSWKRWSVVFVALLSGFGVYLGRYVRLNSWDLIGKPADLVTTVGDIILYPRAYDPALAMTIAFTVVLSTLYFVSQRFGSTENHHETKKATK